ncbi:hypothetical protein MHB65_10915 [Lysinibacillus sp. FSL K6-0075]|uniref:hypothetical protein n=1 Tax=Lysinibacillus sp. FSL K6-0075 TaxID=2921415 RepID=UPI00315852AC
MKKIILLFSLLAVLLVTAGCLNEMVGQKITVQKRTGKENIFEEFKEVNQSKRVEKAIDLVKNANWEDKKVEMTRYADYQFQFPFKNSSENKIASYSLWVIQNGENVEIVTDSDKYVKLTKQDSANLYEILTGEELIK